jgi:hypothetical protein
MTIQLFTEMPPLTGAQPGPARTRTAALISQDNGVGLSVDMDLLDSFLTTAGYRVIRVNWRNALMPRVDLGVFLELYSHRLAGYASKRIGIFNPEWFMPQWRVYLPTLDQLWAKSHQAVELFSNQKLPVHYTGFLTRDFGRATGQQPRAVHLMGRSEMKNTAAVIEAWTRYPDLPPLTIITSKSVAAPRHITVLGRLSDQDLRHQLATARFHICPSRAEGWAHYISEALTLGAHVVTTDASPMNEHVHPEWGSLIRPYGARRRFQVHEYDVDPEDIAAAVRRAAALDDTVLDAQGDKARAHALARNDAFKNTALGLLEKL